MPENKRACTLLAAVLPVLCVTCGQLTDTGTAPPYVISAPVCVAGERTGYYQFAGIEFYFLNTGGKDIGSITVSFMLFDRETGKTPLAGSNLFRLNMIETVHVNEKKEMVIGLDPYIYVAPAEPYIVDFFYIAGIRYTDGSTWDDPQGIYHTGSQ